MTQEDLDYEYNKEVKVDENEQSLKPPTPFKYLIMNCYISKDFEKIIKRGFKFFIHEPVRFIYDDEDAYILIGNLKTELELVKYDATALRIINEDNYFYFQNMIRESLGHSKAELPEDLSQLDPRIARFKRKARERDRVKAKQEAKKLLA